MRAVEVTGTIDREGHLLLDQPFDVDISSRVRVIEQIQAGNAVGDRILCLSGC